MKKSQKPELFRPSEEEVSAAAKRLVVESCSKNTEQKIKCYTMTIFGSTLTDSNLDNIVETLKVEIAENLEEEQMPVAFVFGIEYLTQSEIDALGEFDGF